MESSKRAPKIILDELKSLDFKHAHVQLAIVKEYKQGRLARYIVKFVNSDKKLVPKLKEIVLSEITKLNRVEAYTFDSPEPEGGLARSMDYTETDFHKIYARYDQLNPEEDTIQTVEDLAKAKAYMIVITGRGKEIIGYKRLPETWKPVADRNLFNVLFKDKIFVDLKDANIFTIAHSIDFLYCEETLFILSKKGFERALHYKENMIHRADTLYREVTELRLFVNLDVLQQRVGDNQRYLRQLAIIQNLGHYKNQIFLDRLRLVAKRKQWNIQFVDGQISITEKNVDDVLIFLQNKRLHSELTEEDFDVESATLV